MNLETSQNKKMESIDYNTAETINITASPEAARHRLKFEVPHERDRIKLHYHAIAN